MKKEYLRKGGGRLAGSAHTTRLPGQSFDPKGKKTWDEFVGEKYAKNFRKLQISNQATIVEVGPGSVSKVGLGLKQFGLGIDKDKGFEGTIIIIEPESKALEALAKQYQELMPNAKIVKINLTLDKALEPGGEIEKYDHIDLVVGNHPLDDFISGKSFKSQEELINFFTDHYEGAEAKKTAHHWEKIAKDVNGRMKVYRDTVDEWKKIIQKADNVILSAYDSHFFSSHEQALPSIRHADVFAQRALKEIRESLVETHKINSLKKDDVIQHPAMWISAKKTTYHYKEQLKEGKDGRQVGITEDSDSEHSDSEHSAKVTPRHSR
jgi:hypothetical protein